MLKGRVFKNWNLLSLAKGNKNFGLTKASRPFSTLDKIQEGSRRIVSDALAQTEAEDQNRKFNEFCQTLWKVYEYENKRVKDAERRDKEFLLTAMTSYTPLKDTLRIFEAFSKEGFDDEHLASCLSQVAKVLRIFSEKSSFYHDITVPISIQSNLTHIRRFKCLKTGDSTT